LPSIHQLPSHVADLIAAGEVVERPASAAKELIENAIDAGALSVTVEITGGGSVFLRVTDDGCGMSPEDAQRAFLRHATSKISTAEDLGRIKTLGFRGEALAAIAAVSRVDLLTREQDAAFGMSIRVEGGEIIEASQAGCPVGTTIIIRDLFYNTPARRAFLKKENHESLQIQNAVIRAAQSHPETAFTFLRDGREDVRTPGNGELSACLHSLWGRDVSARLEKVEGKHLGGELRGYVARPEITRGSREMQYFFINGRPVRSRTMYAGLEDAFRYAVPAGRYPICSLHLTLPENLYDVNVHPAKLEVKFANDRAVFEIVYAGVRDALAGNQEHKRWAVKNPAAAATSPPSPAQTRTDCHPSLLTEIAAGSYAKTRMNKLVVESSPVQPPGSDGYPSEEKGTLSEQQALPDIDDFRYVGEVLGGFIIVERDNELILIDKHAAHERRLFEKLAASDSPPPSQTLIAPVVVTLDSGECALILENEKIVKEIGYELSEFGGATLAVRAVPEGVDVSDIAAMLSDMAAILKKGKRTPWEEIHKSLLEMVACKAAVKVGRRFSEEEALEIVRWVLRDKTVWFCPHGRPVAVVMTREDINKQFLR
jgi:DNA mismatch repair protein MutL